MGLLSLLLSLPAFTTTPALLLFPFTHRSLIPIMSLTPWARWGDWRRKPEEVELAHVLLAVHAVMQGKADQKRVDFRTVLPAPSSRRLAPVVIHAQQWERWLMEMLLNLSNNALRHARGRAELVIPEAQSVEDGQLRFEVHDDGSGVRSDRGEELEQTKYCVKPLDTRACLSRSTTAYLGVVSRRTRGAYNSNTGKQGGLTCVKEKVEALGGSCGFGRSMRLGGAGKLSRGSV